MFEKLFNEKIQTVTQKDIENAAKLASEFDTNAQEQILHFGAQQMSKKITTICEIIIHDKETNLKRKFELMNSLDCSNIAWLSAQIQREKFEESQKKKIQK